jgi:hypothetical protein
MIDSALEERDWKDGIEVLYRGLSKTRLQH